MFLLASWLKAVPFLAVPQGAHVCRLADAKALGTAGRRLSAALPCPHVSALSFKMRCCSCFVPPPYPALGFRPYSPSPGWNTVYLKGWSTLHRGALQVLNLAFGLAQALFNNYVTAEVVAESAALG